MARRGMDMILHVDLNSFYASVAVLDSGGKYTCDTPLMVCGDPAKRQGIVLAATYPVKKLGVHAGMPLWEARSLCPRAVIAPPSYKRYMELSEAFMRIMEGYSPLVMRFGIDEAYLDYRGCEHIFGPPEAAAQAIRRRVRGELGLTVSVGVGDTLIKAKMGSDYRKPDAVTVVDEAAWRRLIWPLPVEALQFVGRSTGRRLRGLGIGTIERLAKTQERYLTAVFGKNGRQLWLFANGMDERRITAQHEPQQGISHSATLSEDATTLQAVARALLYQTERVAARLREMGLRASLVGVRLRYADLRGQGKQGVLARPSDLTGELYGKARELLEAIYLGGSVRQVGVQVGRLTGELEQVSLFDGPRRDSLHRLDRAVDALRAKYGSHAVMRGGTMAFAYDEKEDFTPFQRG